MRQTSPTASEAHGKRADALPAGGHQRLRDVERWKDKIEIRLDNRQVAFLFFGSALIACLLFILGVIVGKRLESRGHALAPEIEDPLALLDRVASSVPSSPVARTLGQVAISRAHAAAPAPRPAAKVAKAEVKPAVAPEADDVAPALNEAVAVRPAPVARPSETPPAPAAPVAKAKPAPVAPVAAVAKALPAAVVPPPVRPVAGATPELLPPTGMPVPSVASTSKPAAAVGPPGRVRFMLQVGSFLDRAEAETVAASLAGERAQVITSEIPGKGTWYRVRVGGYAAFKDAVEAKLAFERRHSKIALVVGPL